MTIILLARLVQNRSARVFLRFQHRRLETWLNNCDPHRGRAFTGLVKGANMDYVCAIEFRPKDLASPRATRRTDDLLPISIIVSRLRESAAYLNTYLKEVSHDARNRKVVQQPKRLWLYPAR
jgi:hypothetical protein